MARNNPQEANPRQRAQGVEAKDAAQYERLAGSYVTAGQGTGRLDLSKFFD
jgi:hypothetical protein